VIDRGKYRNVSTAIDQLNLRICIGIAVFFWQILNGVIFESCVESKNIDMRGTGKMFLLICALDKDVSKESVESIVSNDQEVKLVTWMNGQNGKGKELKDTPFIGGSLMSMFKYEEQEVLMVKIIGKDNVDRIVTNLKHLTTVNGELDYYVVPLVA